MAHIMRSQENESEKSQLMSESENSPHEASKVSQHMSHDKLCDSVHEKVISSELAMRNISTLTLQDGRRCLSMQERSTKSHNFPNSKRD